MHNLKETITAADFKQMMLHAYAAIESNKQSLNEMNVFPVPDGDTGVNMSLTMKAAATAISKVEPETVGAVAELAASSLLRGARGNSGVILSLLFRGVARYCAGRTALDAQCFAGALDAGVVAAYSAVMKPAEGTILTVAKSAAAAAKSCAADSKDIIELLGKTIEHAEIALAETMEINPVLKKAGVVDAGGKGWALILAAMCDALNGKEIVIAEEVPVIREGNAPIIDEDIEITFAYCTEYIVTISKAGKKLDVARLRAFLESIGDCVVVVDDDEIIKVHVHTNNPDKALSEALRYGDLINIKIENMREQHTQKVIRDENRTNARSSAKPEKKYGFVAIGAGEGIESVFRDLGVDELVKGGQTMNPSTQDILAAIDKTPAEIVFVFPNNKNIVMAAQQTVDLSDKQVVVIPTSSMPQGISAMLAFDADKTADENTARLTAAANKVKTGSVTYAARDSDYDGNEIHEGEYLALNEGKLSSNGEQLDSVVEKLFSDMAIAEREFITIFYGEGASEESAAAVEAVCRKAAPKAEIMVLEGGQPVYYYIISAE
ncbi:MAG: DAK2 domain-containing protein [Clostridia bacterium]